MLLDKECKKGGGNGILILVCKPGNLIQKRNLEIWQMPFSDFL
jgi:hypothetical protein